MNRENTKKRLTNHRKYPRSATEAIIPAAFWAVIKTDAICGVKFS